MIKFDVKNRFTGDVQFTAEIDAEETDDTSVKLGLAIRWAIKSRADLYGADLYGAYLSGADLSDANLTSADLYGANLTSANLSGANLTSANLYGANLTSADLYGANLYGAYLYGADLYGAYLSGADLSDANLTSADLTSAKNAPNIFSFGPIGKEWRTAYAYEHDGKINIRLGCFNDTTKEAIKKVSKKYGAKSEYVAAIKLAEKVIKARMK